MSDRLGDSERPVRKRKGRLLDREAGDRARGYKRKPPPPALIAALAAPPWKFAVGIFLRDARRTCQAKTRAGTPCKALALKNGRCRNHGGLSTGPKTAAGWRRTRAGYRRWLESRR
jgi:hypothetical protein